MHMCVCAFVNDLVLYLCALLHHDTVLVLVKDLW